MKTLVLLTGLVASLWIQNSNAMESVFPDKKQIQFANTVNRGVLQTVSPDGHALSRYAQNNLIVLSHKRVTSEVAQLILIGTMVKVGHSREFFSIVELLSRSPLTQESQLSLINLDPCNRSEYFVDIIAQQKWLSSPVRNALASFIEKSEDTPEQGSALAVLKARELIEAMPNVTQYLEETTNTYERSTDRARAALEAYQEATIGLDLKFSISEEIFRKLTGALKMTDVEPTKGNRAILNNLVFELEQARFKFNLSMQKRPARSCRKVMKE